METGQSRALWLLGSFVFIHIISFISLTFYQIERIRTLEDDNKFQKSDAYDEVIRDLITTLGHKREEENTINEALPNVLSEFIDSQKDFVHLKRVNHTTTQVIELFKEFLSYLYPNYDVIGKHRIRRQSSTGNEMAQIFQQIAQNELQVFDKYCGGNSTICLPGPKGEPGSKGDRGERGAKGDDGLVGIPGKAGAKGDRGPTGYPGLKGGIGPQGFPGKAGPQGIAGPSGSAGQKGENGTKGEPGLKGDRGERGDKGEEGLVGIPGKAGVKGDRGLMGYPGLKGDIGPQGFPGQTGPQGIAGPSGSAGQKGEKGPKGEHGLKGDRGEHGDKGEEGLVGIPGNKGVKGDVGPMGYPGLKGDIGPQGFPGETGPQGNAGPSGSDGQKGEKGEQGAEGPRGEKGDQGDQIGNVPMFKVSTDCCNNLAKPSFVKDKEIIRVVEGTSVTLQCDVTGSPVPSIQWNALPSSLDANRLQNIGNNLIIQTTLPTDSGSYSCIANSALGTASKQIQLEVYKHISVSELPQNHTILMGQSVQLECKFNSTPSPSVTWYHILPGNSRTQVVSGVTPISGGSQLHISTIGSQNTGEYICEASNGLETVDLHAFIIPQGPPHVAPQQQVSGKVGESITLSCNAQGNPKPAIKWLSPPNVNNAYEDKDGTLVILNAKKGDAGPYICTATNSFGQTQSTVTLIIQDPPHVQIISNMRPIGQTTTNFAIDCKATGDQPLTVNWYHNGQMVQKDGKHMILPDNTLLILGVNKSLDVGKYVCVASNAIGTANETAYVYENRGSVDCTVKFATCRGVCGVNCPSNCHLSSSAVYGTTNYDQESAICKTGIHSGSISTSGGNVVWEEKPASSSYTASIQNGVSSVGLGSPFHNVDVVPIVG